MIFRELPLSGAYEITLEKRTDSRGFFARFYCEDEFAAHGLNTTWAQMNLSSFDAKGTLRGLHFQREPAAEIKLVRCVQGRVWDMIVDLRRDSTSFGTHCSVTLDADAANAIYIPKGFAHGFICLEYDTIINYKCSEFYNPKSEVSLLWNDKTLNIDWLTTAPILSKKDEIGLVFGNFESPF